VRDVLDTIIGWWAEDETFGLATMVDTYRSAPRDPGAALAVSGEVIGSVSGGCVEGAVYELSGPVARSGQPVLQRYGVSDDDAFAVGLTCGGILDIFVEPVSKATFPELGEIAAAVGRGEPVAVATIIAGPGQPGARRVIWGDAAPRMLVFGAIDFAAAVARVGKFLGFHVTVCDARPVFATRSRFPDADEVVVDWPHRFLTRAEVDARTAICVLTHDPKFDVPVLEVAPRTPAGYVGAMGSRRTHEDRLERLREAGLTEPELARLRSPIGLDLGARTPEETAVSIAAELIQLRWGGTGRALSSTDGRIHPDALTTA